jgi:tRNA (cytidine/uridine-2'-O-)-methyltransferase
MFHVVLYQPEIPHNTGAVGRLCLATGARLHLIKPLGFTLDDTHLKRAGLDYWREVDVRIWESMEALRDEAGAGIPWFFLSTKANKDHWDAEFPSECFLVFGPETRGLPESLLHAHADTSLRVPMLGTRSLNLATSVGIVLYEALRQQTPRPFTSQARNVC